MLLSQWFSSSFFCMFPIHMYVLCVYCLFSVYLLFIFFVFIVYYLCVYCLFSVCLLFIFCVFVVYFLCVCCLFSVCLLFIFLCVCCLFSGSGISADVTQKCTSILGHYMKTSRDIKATPLLHERTIECILDSHT